MIKRIVFRYCFFFFGLLSGLAAYAQETDSLYNDLYAQMPGRWRWKVVVGVDRCNRSFKTTDSNYASMYNFRNAHTRRPGLGGHLGLNFLYHYSRDIMVETGLILNNNSFSVSKYNLPFLAKKADSTDTIVYANRHFNYEQLYLCIPISVKFIRKSNDHFKWYLCAGTGINILVANSDESPGARSAQAPVYNPVLLVWSLGTGAMIRWGKEFWINLEPTLSGTLSPVLQKPNGGSYFTAGFSLGLIYEY